MKGRSLLARTGAALLAAAALTVGIAAALVATEVWSPGWLEGAAGAEQVDDALIGPNYYASGKAVCGLLGPEDLELALGYAYKEGREGPAHSPAFAGMPITRCDYPRRGGGEALHTGVVYAYAEQVLDEYVERHSKHSEVTQLDGPGRRTVWIKATSDLLALADGKLVGVIPPGSGSGEQRIARAQRLAAKMIERLR